MRVLIVRTMPNFSMDIYADGIISGLKVVRPQWEIVELAPCSIDRNSRSLLLRAKKFYERFWGFPRTIQNQVADIFHIIDHSEGHIVNWVKNQGKPIVVTCHDLINYFYPDNLQGSVQVPFVSSNLWFHSVKAMQNANHILAVSSATAQDVTQILNIHPQQITVTPNAVESAFHILPDNQIASFRHKQGISPETICLLNVGGNHPRKNISTILQVVKILQQKGLNIHFWKAGAAFTSEEQNYIQTQALENYITYLGQPDKQTLVQIYNAADILIAPSTHEGFGITILEAMACGTPVITSKVSAMPEVAGDAGVLVDPTNAQEIAEAVYHLHNNPIDYQKLKDAGLARVKSFTWERTAEKIAEVYEELLEKNKAQTN
ncbi:glycosyltransferase family 4 protein [Tolypothrix sp. FACHB-123]|uniref:glycosyltransferase family 4 protein n=1 Tax=Tolypothrix sp. FACHB-123 TaxID=2692868 RepID=UPI0016851447|nr:glycosyltransferase family 1 protein [Tolypothrix sp. FACHB-123]MBD2355804.1 glycosyltransferase family 4 protein [Tolypothrix sp. FACHB-123]